ncbi:MAG: glycosyltransferase family 4 protein [Deltaproteobacteria bacterium]|nr:glycosyltransferase family 4 protein [Deltaproteobacteria bacterium]
MSKPAGGCRVTVMSPGAELGGAERSLLAFLQASGAYGLETSVILPRGGALALALASQGRQGRVVQPPRALLRQSRHLHPVSLAMATLLPVAVPRYLARLAAAIRAEAPDVLYSNGVKAHLLASALGPWLGVPVVWHVRDFLDGPLLTRLADKVPQRVIANSEAVAAHLSRGMRQPHKVCAIHNAVDLNEFSPAGRSSSAAMRYPAPYRVGLPAVLARWKGQLLFLDAVERIRQHCPGTLFFIIGGSIYDTTSEWGYERELRGEIARRRLDEVVVITGFQRDMAPWYRALDVCVHASTRPEPFGRTVMEAMACGRALVAARAGGIPELVSHGQNGLLYPMGDARALADAVVMLLSNPRERLRLGVAARAAAVERFSPERYAASIASVLRAAADSKTRCVYNGLDRSNGFCGETRARISPDLRGSERSGQSA